MKVRDVMTAPAITVAPEASYGEVVHCLLANNISGAPVVDAAGHLVGVVSETDLVLRHADPTATVRQLMSANPVTASLDEELAVVTRRMLAASVTRLPVVRDGAVVGIVTRHDLLLALVRPDHVMQAEITAILADTTRSPANEASCTVLNAEVTLTGTVATLADAARIEALVVAVEGVVSIDNQLALR